MGNNVAMDSTQKVGGLPTANNQMHSFADAPASQAAKRIPKLIGDSAGIQRIKRTIEKIAPTDMTVLLTGESGTGKEEVARIIHLLSKRAVTMISAINCAAFPAELIELSLIHI